MPTAPTSVPTIGSGSDAVATVRSYYQAYRAGSPEAVAAALSALFSDQALLRSPLVLERSPGPLVGRAAIVSVAASAAPLLAHAKVHGVFVNVTDPFQVATFIEVPTPMGPVAQAEHFTVDRDSHLIVSLDSYYDPRKLLALSAMARG